MDKERGIIIIGCGNPIKSASHLATEMSKHHGGILMLGSPKEVKIKPLPLLTEDIILDIKKNKKTKSKRRQPKKYW